MPPPPDRLRRAGLAAWSVLGIVALAVVVGYGLYVVRVIFPPLALAMLIIFLLNPLVNALEKRGLRRGLGTVGIYLIFVWAVISIGTLLAPPLQSQWKDLEARWPDIRQKAGDLAEKSADRVGLSLDDLPLPRINDAGASGGKEGEGAGLEIGSLSALFQGFRGFATGAIHLVLIFVLAPFFALYLLIDLPKIKRTLTEYLPPDHRDEWLVVGRRCAQVVGGFFRGQLLVATIVGVLSAFAFSLLKLPFWLPIGALAGFFNIIPLVGPFVGGAVAVVVGAFTGGWDMAAWAALAMLIVQQIDNHFISPKVMGKTVSLHPVAVMIALLLGGTLAGFWGILMAVPILGVTKVIAGHYYETRVLGIPDQDPLSAGGLVTEVGKGEPAARVRQGKKEAKGLLRRWRRA